MLETGLTNGRKRKGLGLFGWLVLLLALCTLLGGWLFALGVTQYSSPPAMPLQDVFTQPSRL